MCIPIVGGQITPNQLVNLVYIYIYIYINDYDDDDDD